MTKKLTGRKSTGAIHERPREAKRRPTQQAIHPKNQGIPEEHYYGEQSSKAVGKPADAGALDHELLAKDAPDHRTFGAEPDGR
jgi:hypothetical protein